KKCCRNQCGPKAEYHHETVAFASKAPQDSCQDNEQAEDYKVVQMLGPPEVKWIQEGTVDEDLDRFAILEGLLHVVLQIGHAALECNVDELHCGEYAHDDEAYETTIS